VNDGLAHGRYFFMDVARDGIALYESDSSELHTPKPKTPAQALAMAKEYFEEWFPSALVYLGTARDLVTQGRNEEPAFILHQSAERLYHCVLLVVTFYTPHVHNLGFLRTQAERIENLGQVVHAVCSDRIAKLEQDARQGSPDLPAHQRPSVPTHHGSPAAILAAISASFTGTSARASSTLHPCATRVR